MPHKPGGHGGHEGGDGPPGGPRSHWYGRLELAITVLLGMAAIVGAFAAYKNEQHNHDSTLQFTDGLKNFNDSGQYYSDGNAISTNDQAQFLAYAQANYVKHYGDANYIRDSLMRPVLRKSVKWWDSYDTPAHHAASPFVDKDPYYVIDSYGAAQEKANASKKNFKEAKAEQNKADHFTLVEVILATALFLYGIAGVTRNMTVKLGTLGMGFSIFILSLALLATG